MSYCKNMETGVLHLFNAISYRFTEKRDLFQTRDIKEVSSNNSQKSLAGVAQWIEYRPANLVRAHAWVVGQIHSRGHVRGNHTLMFFSLSFSPPYPLPINKVLKKKRKKSRYRNHLGIPASSLSVQHFIFHMVY